MATGRSALVISPRREGDAFLRCLRRPPKRGAPAAHSGGQAQREVWRDQESVSTISTSDAGALLGAVLAVGAAPVPLSYVPGPTRMPPPARQ